MKTFTSAYINLLKTSIGSGVLSFPYLFKTYGIGYTILFTIISGYFATIGLILLSVCSQVLGRRSDMNSLAAIATPYARFFVNAAVLFKCFGVSLSYLIISKELIPMVIRSRSSIFNNPIISILIFLSLIGPFVYFTKLDKLKYTSFLGIFCIASVIVAAMFRFCKSSSIPKLEYFAKPDTHWITGWGKFIFSFTCHQNIFSVNSELVDNSLKNMKKLIYCVSSTSFLLYLSFGLTNYLIYGDHSLTNILKNYPNDNLAVIVRGMYIVVMGVSYPLQMAPARTYFLNIFNINKKTKNYKIIHFLTTSMLITFTYLLAVSGIELGIVYSVVGATASCFMCLIFPALFYFNLDIEKTFFYSCLGYIAFLIGIFIFISTIFTLVYNK